MIGWLLILGQAEAQDYRAWQGLQDGLLLEETAGDLGQAVSWYEGLVESMKEEDPTRAQVYLWLSRAYFMMGDSQRAREALARAEASPLTAQQARSLRGQMDAIELRITELPIEHDFSTGTSHWISGWRYSDRSSIRSESLSSGEEVLTWQHSVVERREARIQVGFDEGLSPSHFQLRLLSSEFPAWILPGVEDRLGTSYFLDEPLQLDTSEWLEVQLQMSDFQPPDVEGSWKILNAQQIQNFVLIDVTSWYSSDRGENSIHMDLFRVR